MDFYTGTSLDLSFSAQSLRLRERALEVPVPLQHTAVRLYTSTDSGHMGEAGIMMRNDKLQCLSLEDYSV